MDFDSFASLSHFGTSPAEELLRKSSIQTDGTAYQKIKGNIEAHLTLDSLFSTSNHILAAPTTGHELLSYFAPEERDVLFYPLFFGMARIDVIREGELIVLPKLSTAPREEDQV